MIDEPLIPLGLLHPVRRDDEDDTAWGIRASRQLSAHAAYKKLKKAARGADPAVLATALAALERYRSGSPQAPQEIARLARAISREADRITARARANAYARTLIAEGYARSHA